MKLTIIGAPGSGKSWLAAHLSLLLQMDHVDGDKLFWNEGVEVSLEEFRLKVNVATQNERWIYEGHIGKVGDLVLPRAQKIILIEYSDFLSFVHVLQREGHNLLFTENKLMSFKKLYFNLQNYERLTSNRTRIINEVLASRPQDVIVWKNYVDSVDDLVTVLKNPKLPY